MATAKYRKGDDGYFTAHVWDGTYINGKRHYKTIRSRKSSRDLENKVNQLKAEVEERKYVKKSNLTFIEYARSWKKVYKQQREGNTRNMYENVIEKHLIILNNIPLQDIDRIHLQMVLNNADGKKRTQQQILMTFKQIIRSAVTDQLYPANVAENIFQNIDPVKYTPAEKRPLTENERIAVFKASFNEQDKIFVYLIYGCGIRREEALALTIFDFDLKKKELTINKAHEFSSGKPLQKEPKTKNGYRTLPIPWKIFQDVEAYINYLKSSGKTYLFTMRNGKPVTQSSYTKMWQRILRRMQEVASEPIVGLTAHVFRHNYCTNLCYQIPKLSIKKIAQLMGDTEAVVLKVYNHIILEKEDAEAAVNDAMNL